MEIYFLNPSEKLQERIKKELFEFKYSTEHRGVSNINETKGKKEVSMITGELSGKYIKIICTGISEHKLREKLLVCPECGSNKLQVSILHCWKNEETDQLCEEGKLKYGFGAYDRVGMKPETKRCLNCVCSWHNEADIYY